MEQKGARMLAAGEKIAILCGGSSNERGISIKSGTAVFRALNEKGYETKLIDPADEAFMEKIRQFKPKVAFLAMHGRGGEDGVLQGVLEYLGIPYTGSGVLASAAAMDKRISKLFYREVGINVPESMVIDDYNEDRLVQLFAAFSGKVVAKAADEGSARNVFVCGNEAELLVAAKALFENHDSFLLERFVFGRELTVAVVEQSGVARALPVIEIVPKNSFYDFESKYSIGGAEHICPAFLDEDIANRCKNAAVQAHMALGCSGVSRSDFILDSNGTPWILETNTLPGMTETSLLPDAGRADGISFVDLCEIIAHSASLGK